MFDLTQERTGRVLIKGLIKWVNDGECVGLLVKRGRS